MTSTNTPDAWAWWRAALRGEFGPIHENQPMTGYYRRRTRDGDFEPVAIWYEDEQAFAQAGAADADPLDVWTWVCRNPISVDLYDAAMSGKPWPDIPPAAGHNLGFTPLETLRNELDGERLEIDRLLNAGPIVDQETADRVSNWTARISDIKKRAEAERVAEKRPHDEAAAAVQAKWRPLVDDASDLARKMKDAIGAYLREKQRQAALDRAKLAEQGAPLRAPANAKAGTIGRTIALRTVKTPVINDVKAVAAYFAAMDAPPPDFLEVLKTLAGRVMRAGVSVPGATMVEEQSAA